MFSRLSQIVWTAVAAVSFGIASFVGALLGASAELAQSLAALGLIMAILTTRDEN